MYTTTEYLNRRTWELDVIAPPKTDAQEWDYGRTPTPDDVAVWEVVHHQPGAYTVVAAHDPCIEYYAIVPWIECLPWETFYAREASERCRARVLKLGVDLETHTAHTTLIHSTTIL